MSERDFLTGCLSKESIDSTLARIKADCDVNKKPFSILTIDLDNFKLYNDKYGHLDGDDVLRYFASTLCLILREEESYVFRFGGDEFILVFPGKNGTEAYLIANNIMKILKKRPFLSRGRMFKLAFSSGIASYPSDGSDIDVILRKADKAMYFSKMHGRKRTTLYSLILQKTIERVLFIFVSVLVIAGTLFYVQKTSYRGYITDWLKAGMKKVITTLTPSSIRINSEDIDLVYLKSGRILEGIIVRDDEDEIELNLNLEKGKGLIIIKKADIEKMINR